MQRFEARVPSVPLTLHDIRVGDEWQGAAEWPWLQISVQGGRSVNSWTMPGLLFANDTVPLAESVKYIQWLVTLAAVHLSAGPVVQYQEIYGAGVLGSQGDTPVILANGATLPWSMEYRYLGANA